MSQWERNASRWLTFLVILAAWHIGSTATAHAHDINAAHVHSAANSFSVSPISGAAGSTVQVTGCDWSKGETIEFYFDDPAQKIGETTVTLAGDCFEDTIQIPNSAAAGDHTIEARGSSAATATTEFTVTEAELTITPDQGPAGSPVTFAGCGWTPSSSVDIKWAATNTAIATTTADGSGCINTNGTLPNGTTPGSYVVNATGGEVATNTSFRVTTPELALTPDAGPSGSVATAAGCGWLAGETVSVVWTATGQTLATPAADGDGCISAAVTIPGGQADGSYSVTATGAQAADSSAQTEFTVQPPTLLLFPTAGPGDSTVDAYGCGWVGNSQVTVKWSDDSTLGTSDVNANGCIDLAVTIPASAAVGNHTLTADGDVGGDADGSATHDFEVTNSATLDVSPSAAKVGWPVVVYGLGWAAGETITFYWDDPGNGDVLSTTVAPTGGSFSLVVNVPESANVLTHTVNAQGDKGGSASDTLQVLPEAGLNFFPNNVPAGGWIDVCLYEWTDDERVTLKWPNGLTLASIDYTATDELCQTRALIQAPRLVSAGVYTVTATGNRGHATSEPLTIIPDTERPDVSADHAPFFVSDETSVDLLGEVADNGGIAEISIGLLQAKPNASIEIVRTCEPPLANAGNTPETKACTASGLTLEPGNYVYFVKGEDLAGNVGWNSGSIRVFKAGQPPNVHTGHKPKLPAINGAPEIEVNAEDDGGIRSLFVFIDGQTYPFTYNEPYPTSVSETINYAQTLGKRVVEYDALAFDVEGLSTRAAERMILFDNSGLDSDNDGLSDDIETFLCTSVSGADTDRDFLLDGWEVLGKSFSDGDLVDLPGEGAHPCVRQVFLQLDWEKDVAFPTTSLQYIVNTFQDHFVRLHISGKERPRPPEGEESDIGAFAASEMKDDNGDYFFDPKKNWTHYYGYARHRGGASGAWGNFFSVNMWGGGDLYALIHELGHVMGLGHGGRTGTPVLKFNGDTPYYEGGWNNTNRKPNYVSIMNYRYNGKICYNPTTNKWLADLDYADESMPDLDETDLDERPSSDFVQALQSRSCDGEAGYIPAIVYSCSDPNETEPDGSNTRYHVISDGATTLARRAAGRALQTTSLPSHSPGIDWNCDGQISDSVQENINGTRPGEICDGQDNDNDGNIDEGCDRGWTPTQVLDARFDWPLIPAGRPCHIKRHKDGTYPQGAAYRDAIMGIDCSTLASAAAVQSTAAQSTVGAIAEATAPTTAQSISAGGEPTDTVPHDDDEQTLLFQELPNLELCDGIDNDRNGTVDEGCLDGDGDGVIDAIDNCPLIANTDQLDTNRDYIGDACEAAPNAPTNLSAVVEDGDVTLSWDAPGGDGVDGYAVYRLDPGEATYRYLGDFPSTRTTSFTDTSAAPDQPYRYVVRAMNRYGAESPASQSASVGGGTLYLPLLEQ